MKNLLRIITIALLPCTVYAQTTPDERRLGAWYMYFFQKKIASSAWGFQGDYQYRSWNGGSDLEQLLLRSGITFRPKSDDITFTAGYAYVLTGAYGTGDKATFNENRVYQEALVPQKIADRFYLTHRFRYEQRWVQNQDFRTRFRYNLFVNVPLNREKMEKNAVYLALYNEIFINGETSIGDGQAVQLFDRNRTYSGVGYGLANGLRSQLGWMLQTTAGWQKGQLQLSLHHIL
ncbi:MAG TPA: DUF2490 domain-containing protein [Flavisolibacter sp.]